jgi:hypothetical protein
MSKVQRHFSLEERFAYGNFTIAEVCELKQTCKSVIYDDVAKGRLPVERMRRGFRVPGPMLRHYRPTVGVIAPEQTK